MLYNYLPICYDDLAAVRLCVNKEPPTPYNEGRAICNF